MDYEEARRWLYGLAPRGVRLELDRMRAACALRGDPQRALRAIHVAGTNGKGSVSATIERALREVGLRTGLYTSPHLHSFRERVRVGGEPIAEDEVARRATELRAVLEGEGAPPLTFFEVTTLLALERFRDAACDVVVLEVGLGGRFDATNVIEAPLACAITSIGLDHQAYLGDTIEAIAAEKAGILKPGVPAAIAEPLEPAAWEVIRARAEEIGSPLVRAGAHLERVPAALALEGEHQRANAALAIATLGLLAPRIEVPEGALARALADVRWPGRLERVAGAPRALLDAAHNPEGCRALAAQLAREVVGGGRRALVFGAMADKDWRAMLAILRPEIDALVAVAPPLGRAEAAGALASAGAALGLDAHSASSVADGIDLAREIAGAGGIVVVAGSIFVLAAARAHLLGIASEPPIGM